MLLETQFIKHREKQLSGLWIHYNHIKPLLKNIDTAIIKTSIIGYSEDKVPIYAIKMGSGPIKIALWSQMHGDESTATKSIFDILNFINKEYVTNKDIVKLLETSTLLFIPMLNPDGALAYTRENARGVDLNRDAKDLQSTEAQVLMRTIKEFNPHYAFNLHDQSSFYNTVGAHIASLSFLSPSANEARDITSSRRKAMQIIANMNSSLQEYIPNQIGRYNDVFNANCFGDAFQMMNIPTILIESGYFKDDETREKTRKYHFIALLTALFAIAHEDIQEDDTYFDIPLNQKQYYDVRINNVLYNNVLTKIGVRFVYKIEDNKLLKIIDTTETIVGDALVGNYFHNNMDAKGKPLEQLF